MVCDGLLRAGQAHILDETYTNCVDQTSSCMFYAIAATENLLIYGANISNKASTFTPIVPSMNGGYIICTTHHWNQTKSSLFSLQCKATLNLPRLWEKHADSILQDIGMTPTVHKPCLYSGIINGKRTLL
jgi:hypothetical protein